MMKHVLLVDETPLLATLMSDKLAQLGPSKIHFDLASSVKQAIALLQQKAFDLLLINSQADRLDALEVLGQLREADCETEAIAVAGWLTPQLVEHGENLGVSRFFRLPAEVDAFACHLKFS